MGEVKLCTRSQQAGLLFAVLFRTPSVIAHIYTHILYLTAVMNKPDAHVWTWIDLKAT